MFIYSCHRNTLVFHKQDCPYISRIKKENLKYFYMYKERIGLKRGKSLFPCEFCFGIFRKIRKDRKDIIDFCQKNELTFQVEHKMIIVDDIDDKWIITFSMNVGKIVLYHKNKAKQRFSPPPSPYEKICGYHHQSSVKCQSFLKILKAICDHRKISRDRISKRLKPQLKYSSHKKKTTSIKYRGKDLWKKYKKNWQYD